MRRLSRLSEALASAIPTAAENSEANRASVLNLPIVPATGVTLKEPIPTLANSPSQRFVLKARVQQGWDPRGLGSSQAGTYPFPLATSSCVLGVSPTGECQRNGFIMGLDTRERIPDTSSAFKRRKGEKEKRG